MNKVARVAFCRTIGYARFMTDAALPVFRFAPSPNGRMHLGHAYCALLNAELAKRLHGRFLLRMEDIDTTRCTAELARLCVEDLAWLGLEWEEPVRVQSHHWDDYDRAVTQLKQQGVLYPCFCTRRDIAQNSDKADPDGAPLYPGTCAALSDVERRRRIEQGEPHSWRLHMNEALRLKPGPYMYTRFLPPSFRQETVQAVPQRWGDVIIVRKEIPTSYHLSVVIDDALQKISHVVRGADLEMATDLHVLLQALLGLPAPLYYHHALLIEAGEKLSKSKGSTALAELRERGFSPRQIRHLLEQKGLTRLPEA